jgi:phosphatidylglycerophosphate synthase
MLSGLGVRAGAVTAAALIVGLTFPAVWHWSPAWSLLLLAVHVVLDGVDGPLARWQQRPSARGSFTDTVCDQLVLSGVILALINGQRLDAVAGSLFLFLYTLVVAFAMVRNALGVPYSWVVRPRFVVYVAIPAEVWLRAGVMTPLCVVLAVLLGLKAASGFVAIRRALPGGAGSA